MQNILYSLFIILLYLTFPISSASQESRIAYCTVNKKSSSNWPTVDYGDIGYGLKSDLEKKGAYISSISSFDNKRQKVITLFGKKGWVLIDDKSKSENEFNLQFELDLSKPISTSGGTALVAYCTVNKKSSSNWPTVDYGDISYGLKSDLEKKGAYISSISSFDNKRQKVITLFGKKGWVLIDDKSKSENEFNLQFELDLSKPISTSGGTALVAYCTVNKKSSSNWPTVDYGDIGYGLKSDLEKKGAYISSISSFDNKRQKVIALFESKGWVLIDDKSKSESDISLFFSIKLE